MQLCFCSTFQMYIPLKNQAELDAVLRLLDQNEHSTSLRLYLTPAVAGTEPSSTQSHSTVAPVSSSLLYFI